jgi:hypothetical protein
MEFLEMILRNFAETFFKKNDFFLAQPGTILGLLAK